MGIGYFALIIISSVAYLSLGLLCIWLVKAIFGITNWKNSRIFEGISKALALLLFVLGFYLFITGGIWLVMVVLPLLLALI